MQGSATDSVIRVISEIMDIYNYCCCCVEILLEFWDFDLVKEARNLMSLFYLANKLIKYFQIYGAIQNPIS